MKNLLLLLLIAINVPTNIYSQTFTNYTTVDGLLHNSISSLDVDANNELWIGTLGGISQFDGSTWTDYTKGTYPGLADNSIQAIMVASNGDVWVGTDFGASVYKGSTFTTYTTTDGLGHNQIKCISEASNGDIWFGTLIGSSKFDGTNWSSLGTSDGLPFGGVSAINFAQNGDVWLGTGLGGIAVYDGTNLVMIEEVDGLISDKVRTVAVTSTNKKWVGTSAGISVFNSSDAHTGNHTIIFTLPAPDTTNPVEDIKIDSYGRMWVGVYVDYLVTEGGVSMYEAGQWIDYDVNDGLIGPVVRELAIDTLDNVWVGTSTGLTKISNVPVGMEDELNAIPFTVYPNPATHQFHVRFDGGYESFVGSVDIYNSTMQLVSHSEVRPGEREISVNVNGLSQGLYFVNVGGEVCRLIVN